VEESVKIQKPRGWSEREGQTERENKLKRKIN